MVNYRRNRAKNGVYFFTISLRDRRSSLLVERIDALYAAWRSARRRVPHRIDAFVVMPDHLHAIITMKDGRDNYSRLIQDAKKDSRAALALKTPARHPGSLASGSTPSAMRVTYTTTSITSISIRSSTATCEALLSGTTALCIASLGAG